MFVLRLISIFIVASPALALIAYHCDGPSVNMTSVSLTTVPDCPPPDRNTTFETKNILVSQIQEQYTLEYRRCKVETFNFIYYCAKWAGIDRFHRGSMFSTVVDVSREECDRMFESKVYYTRSTVNDKVVVSLENSIGKVSIETRGSIVDKECTPGETFHHRGEVYERPVITTEVKVEHANGTGIVIVDDNIIKFPNGNTCPLSSGYCFSADYGHIYWKVPTPACPSDSTQKSMVYTGNATLVTHHQGGHVEKYIQVTFEGFDFQILMSEQTEHICGYLSFFTEHPGLFITFLGGNRLSFNMPPVSALDVSLLNYVNSKLVYAVRHVKQEVVKLFDTFHHDRCVTHNRITKNMLTLAVLSPTEFAYMYSGPGHTALIRGEVVYIAKCTPVAVSVNTELPGCYNELPVILNNQTMFMSPRTRMLIPVGTPVECLPGVAPLFQLNDNWYKKTQYGLERVESPHLISPDVLSYRFEEMSSASNGLYSYDLIKKYQQTILSPMVASVITARISDSVSGSGTLPDSYSFINGFKTSDFDIIQYRMLGWWDRFVAFAPNAGGWFGFFMAASLMWKMGLYSVGYLFNVRALTPDVGLCWAVLLSISETIANLFHHGKVFQGRHRRVERDLYELPSIKP